MGSERTKHTRRITKQTAILCAIGVAVACLLGVPLISLAGESAADFAASEEVRPAAAVGSAVEETSSDAALPELKRVKKAKAADKEKAEDDEEDGSSTDNAKRAQIKVAHTLIAVKPQVDEEVEKAKKAPIPSDAIVGVKNLNIAHVDMATERLIASIGEQARYIGQKDGIPASILIAKSITDKRQDLEGLSEGASYAKLGMYSKLGVYAETCSRTLTDGYARSSGSRLSASDSYDEALGKLQEEGLLSEGEASSLSEMIGLYGLDKYDEPLPYEIYGTRYDEDADEPDKIRNLLYSDYVNLERIATSYIGTAYVWGGSSPFTGFDCSGLVQWVYREALGIELPRTTYIQQYVGESIPLDVDELRMGDLLFFYDTAEGTHHVAMYLADGYYIHAPHTGDVVRIASMEEYAPTFARRIADFVEYEYE